MRVFSFKQLKKKKEKKKFSFKIFARIMLAIFIVVALILSPVFLFNPQNFRVNISQYLQSKQEQNQVLSLWHIETFEGGSTSRSAYLQKIATEFNKQNNGVFIIIKTLTMEQARLNVKEGCCDIVSFGFGAGELLKPYLVSLQEVKLEKDFDMVAKNNDNVLAYPYMYGGYATITREQAMISSGFTPENLQENLFNIFISKKNNKAVGFAKKSQTNFAKALSLCSVFGNPTNFFDNNLDTYQTYCKFIEGEFSTLVGTTRDVVRCKNREMAGKLSSCVYNYLSGYTDLVQCIGVMNGEEVKQKTAMEFATFLLSEYSQTQIKKVGMFSTTGKVLYDDGYMKDFEQAMLKEKQVPNIFMTETDIEKEKAECFAKVCV